MLMVMSSAWGAARNYEDESANKNFYVIEIHLSDESQLRGLIFFYDLHVNTLHG